MSRELAIHGHPPAFPDGPPAWPIADPAVRLALEAAFADGSWGVYEGPNCDAFRAELAQYHNVEFAHLCCSGTSAVEIALRCVGVTAGDEVILSGYDFPGNFRAIKAIGALPVLVDIDANTWSMTSGQLSAAVSEKTTAVLASHLHGGSAEIAAICDFARQRNISVVEDACQAHGASINGRRAGTTGDVGVLSFGGSKLMTSGRGGAILTNSELFLQRAKIYAGEGNDAFAMSELQAAVLRPQLKMLDARNAKRAESVRLLHSILQNETELHPVAFSRAPASASYFKLAWLLASETRNGMPIDRDFFVTSLSAEGMQVGAGFRGFAKRGARRCRKPVPLPNSIAAAEHTILLHHPILLESPDQIEIVADVMRGILTVARGGQ